MGSRINIFKDMLKACGKAEVIMRDPGISDKDRVFNFVVKRSADRFETVIYVYPKDNGYNLKAVRRYFGTKKRLQLMPPGYIWYNDVSISDLPSTIKEIYRLRKKDRWINEY